MARTRILHPSVQRNGPVRLLVRLAGCVLAVATIALIGATGSIGAVGPASAAAADPLGCADQVFDPNGVATAGALASTASQVAIALNADLHVRVEGGLDGDIDGREQRLEQQCAGWLGTDGLRAPDLLVVMVSPTEHATSIYYGEDFYANLSTTDSQIQEFVMNPRFKEGSIGGGLVDGLNAILVAARGGGVPQAVAPAYDPSSFTLPSYESAYDSSSSSSGGSTPVGGIIAVFVIVVIVIVISSFAKSNGWSSSSNSTGYRRSWSSSSSSRSFSSSSHHSSSSGSHSSGSSHSGGGGHSSSW